MATLRLYKREKLCGKTAIDLIFTRGEGSVSTVYPLRAVWRVNDRRPMEGAQFLVSIPKRRFKHAVDRVKLRRRVREAYRLNRASLVVPGGVALDVAFIYLSDVSASYADIERAMVKLLCRISASLAEEGEVSQPAEMESEK